MARKGTYYLGRVLKLGRLDQHKLIEAIKEPVSVEYRSNSWTFIDVKEQKDNLSHYIFGRLSKYKPKGEVIVVNTKNRTEETQIEPNLRVASSPFIYLPDHSGIAFLNVSSKIDHETFMRIFCEIVEETHSRFFIKCDIELVSDLRGFASKLSALDGVFNVNANVSPPNPMFGPLWEELKDYLIDRNTDRLQIFEESPESEPLNTSLPEHIQRAAEQTENQSYVTDEPIPIGDAAILMAMDGYGHGAVRGKLEDKMVVIKTSDTAKNFIFNTDPEPSELYLKVKEIFDRIKAKRHLEH